jgi:hypothetical protein
MDNLECRIKRVEVCDLKENTFYAKLFLEWNGTEIGLDSRPSDAIALALRFSAPIFVEDEIMASAGMLIKEEDQTPKTDTEPKKKLSPVAFLKHKLDRAVTEERYEDAAKFRDELKRLTNSN